LRKDLNFLRKVYAIYVFIKSVHFPVKNLSLTFSRARQVCLRCLLLLYLILTRATSKLSAKTGTLDRVHVYLEALT